VHLLRREQWKSLCEIEAQLDAKHAARSGARAVTAVGAGVEHAAQQIEIGLHRRAGLLPQSNRRAMGAHSPRAAPGAT
jgi:hypothetical protein